MMEIKCRKLTAHEMMTVWPTSNPFTPAKILIELVQKTASSPMYSLYIQPAIAQVATKRHSNNQKWFEQHISTAETDKQAKDTN